VRSDYEFCDRAYALSRASDYINLAENEVAFQRMGNPRPKAKAFGTPFGAKGRVCSHH